MEFVDHLTYIFLIGKIENICFYAFNLSEIIILEIKFDLVINGLFYSLPYRYFA